MQQLPYTALVLSSLGTMASSPSRKLKLKNDKELREGYGRQSKSRTKLCKQTHRNHKYSMFEAKSTCFFTSMLKQQNTKFLCSIQLMKDYLSLTKQCRPSVHDCTDEWLVIIQVKTTMKVYLKLQLQSSLVSGSQFQINNGEVYSLIKLKYFYQQLNNLHAPSVCIYHTRYYSEQHLHQIQKTTAKLTVSTRRYSSDCDLHTCCWVNEMK